MANRRNVPVSTVKQCSACGHNSATYKGSFIRVPREENNRRLWLVRLGIVGEDEPLPIRMFFVCQDHFDMKKDFKQVAGGNLRLRSGTLPWRNLANGEQSYHGLDDFPSASKNSPNCACRCCLKRKIRRQPAGRTVSAQTNDFDLYPPPAIRDLPKGAFLCWFCRGTNGLKALFSGGTALFPALLDQIYTATGILLNASRNENALICKACQHQAEQSWGFRLRARACYGRDGTFIDAKKNTAKQETPKAVRPATTSAPDPMMNFPIPVRNVPKPVTVPKVTVRKVPKSKAQKSMVQMPIRESLEPEPEHFLFEVEPLDVSPPPPEIKRIKLEPPGDEYEGVPAAISIKLEKN